MACAPAPGPGSTSPSSSRSGGKLTRRGGGRGDAQHVIERGEPRQDHEDGGGAEGERKAEHGSGAPARAPISGAARRMRSASRTSAAEASVRCRLIPQPSREQIAFSSSRCAASGPDRPRAGPAPAARAAASPRTDPGTRRVRNRDRSPRSGRRPSRARRPRRWPRSSGAAARSRRPRRENRRRAGRSTARWRARGGGSGASEAPFRRSSVAIASARLSITPAVAIGRVSPSNPARSPLPTQRSAKASAMTAARSILVAGARLDPKRIEADRSNQIQTVWADSHSRSRTKACSPRATAASRTREAGSPDTNGRNCQKISPEPALRRPCTP